jgi:hypothetical protein
MNLTTEHWGKIIIPLAIALILAPFGQFLFWRVRQADVRYATGGAHLSSKLAVSSINLRNFGYSDAEEVTITALFTDPLIDISAGPMGTQFDVTTGGIGDKRVIGTIKRLVPDESIYIYFITEPTSPLFEPGQFIRGIRFIGGQGKTGMPVLFQLLIGGFFLVLAAVYIPLFFFGRKTRESSHNALCEVIQMGQSTAQTGGSEEQLRTRVEEFRQTIPFLRRPSKEQLIRCAETAFRGLTQQ